MNQFVGKNKIIEILVGFVSLNGFKVLIWKPWLNTPTCFWIFKVCSNVEDQKQMVNQRCRTATVGHQGYWYWNVKKRFNQSRSFNANQSPGCLLGKSSRNPDVGLFARTTVKWPRLDPRRRNGNAPSLRRELQ